MTNLDIQQHHPVVVAHRARRAADTQLRVADAITSFAGSMPFVYIHAVVFAVWMLVVESDPWPKLTLIVSLEAIFLSTFVMIVSEVCAFVPEPISSQTGVFVSPQLKNRTSFRWLSRRYAMG